MNTLARTMTSRSLMAAVLAGLMVATFATGALADRESFSGRLSRGDDELPTGEYVDSHTFDGRRGERVSIALESNDFDTYLILLSPDGERWTNDDGGSGTDSALTVFLEESGEYEIQVTSYSSGATGDYDLLIETGGDSDAMVETGRLSRGDNTLPSGEYYDTYEIEAQRGERYRVSVQSDDFDTYLIVNGPDDNLENDDGGNGTNSELTFAADRRDTWEVVVTSYAEGETGEYTLVVERLDGGGDVDHGSGRLRQEYGRLERSDAMLDSGEYFDEYRFEGRRGQRVILELESDDFDAYLILLSPDEEQTEDDDGGNGLNSRIDTVLSENGEYRVMVTTFAEDEDGDYLLTMDLGGAGGGSGDARIERGDLTRDDEQLKEGEYYDRYVLDGERGETVEIELRSDDFDTYLLVITPDGERLTDDDGGSGTNSAMTLRMTERGEYEILVTSYSSDATGDYELIISGMGDGGAPAGRDMVERGELSRQDRELDTGEYYDLYTFDAVRGQRVTIEMESNDFDTYLIVEGPDGERWTNDDGGSGTDSRLEIRIDESGEYEIQATSYASDATGDYTLTVRGLSEQGRPAGGDTVERGELNRTDRELDSGEYYDLYTFEGRRGQEVVIEMESDDFDTYIILEGPDGERWTNDDGGSGTDSRLQLDLPDSGVYRVFASSYADGATGDYRLTISGLDGRVDDDDDDDDDSVGRVYDESFRATGQLSRSDDTIDTGEYGDLYQIRCNDGDELEISVESDDFDTYLIVRAPSGQQWEDDDGGSGTNSGIEIDCDERGVYDIIVTSFATGETGEYELNVDLDD